MIRDPARASRLLRSVDVFVVRFVEHDEDIARNTRHELLHRCGRDPGSRGIVGIGDKDDARAWCDCTQHGFEIMAQLARRNLDAGGTTRLSRERINRECVLGVDRMVTWTQESERDQLKNIVRAVAKHDLLRRYGVSARQSRLERKAVTVGVARAAGNGIDDRLAHARAGPARILVGSELDDAALR